MPAPLTRNIRQLAAVLSLVSAAAGSAQPDQVLHVELNLFSGRPRPKAEITDAGESKAILDSLAARTVAAVPCGEIPPMPSTPLYTATMLHFAVPVVQRHILIVRDGYIYYNTELPCYRDPGGNLEKLAVATAFRYPDMNAPGGPKAMDYLACMVPDSLRAGAQPCATALRPASRALVPAAPGIRPAARYGLDGRYRPPEAALLLYTPPSRP